MFHKLLTIFLLGFSSGLPLALCGSTLQMWFAYDHIDIVAVAMLALVGQPYVYKFVWAPIMDRFVPPLLGRRRGWMVICQVCLIVLLGLLALLQPKSHAVWMGVIAFFIAFFSASQDIVIDAYKTDVLTSKERGLGAALSVEAYRLAMLISGSFSLILADHIGWNQTYMFMSLLMMVGVLASLTAHEPKHNNHPPISLKEAIIKPFVEFLKRDKALFFLLFIILYKLGDAFTGSSSSSLTAVFLHRELGMSLSEVGYISKIIGLIASLIGIFIGGLLMLRIKLFTALMLFGLLQSCANLLFMSLAMAGKNYYLAVGAVFFENLCAGMGTAAFVAFLMSLCNKKYSATQYALLSSVMSIARVYLTPFAGVYVKQLGWVEFYFATVIITIPGLLLLWWLRNEVNHEDEIEQTDLAPNSA